MLASSHCHTYIQLSTSAGLNITFWGMEKCQWESRAGKVFALIWENVQLYNGSLITCVWGVTLIFCEHSSGFGVRLWLIFHYLLHVTSFPLPLLLLDKEWNMGDDLLYLRFIFFHPGLVSSKSQMTRLLSATHEREQQSNKWLIYSSPNPNQPRFTREALSFPFIANTHQRARSRSCCKMKQSWIEITLRFSRTASDKGNNWTCLRWGS